MLRLSMSSRRGRTGRGSTALFALFHCAAGACSRTAQVEQQGSAIVPPDDGHTVVGRSDPLCALVGPHADIDGVYGTDLGYTVPDAASESTRLLVLFGDTWNEPTDACRYPEHPNDDFIATLPARRPQHLASARASAEPLPCDLTRYALSDPSDATSWPRAQLHTPEGQALALGALRTPIAAFRDRASVYALFHRNDPAPCVTAVDCPQGMACSSELSHADVGTCPVLLGALEGAETTFCRADDDCDFGACDRSAGGMCLSQAPFALRTTEGSVTPDWYLEDPRRGLARTMYLGRMAAEGFDFQVVERFVTNRFVNAAARTVAHFDPLHPENNDYRPGAHTLLMWGRSSFLSSGRFLSLPYLLYQALPAAGDALQWSPQFYAGLDDAQRPTWSSSEADAQPIYGTSVSITDSGAIEWLEPELDFVNQMSLAWVESLSRWVMLYGGDVPAFMLQEPAVSARPSQGAIHLRTARHPWGGPADAAWTEPVPVLSRARAAAYMVCADDPKLAEQMPGCLEEGDPYSPLAFLATIVQLATDLGPDAFFEMTAQCLEGEVAMAVQDELSGSSIGRLYGPNIIESWTDANTDAGADGGVDLYWNVSTWNPYQVVLIRTHLSGGSTAHVD